MPNLFELTKGGKVMAFGEGQFIGYGTKEDGSVMFVASTKMPENELEKIAVDFRDKKQVLHWFKNYFSGWDSSWYEFFTNDSV
ncbi:hypothetical protein [Sphingobacterium siyangense]|uniref:hypothetical protein n=1 Tax=Sphingobacterium siyangense TaxID=459529 RepID=UPI003DA38720